MLRCDVGSLVPEDCKRHTECVMNTCSLNEIIFKEKWKNFANATGSFYVHGNLSQSLFFE